MDLATTYEEIKISLGTSFVHETESQIIAKDIGLFQEVADRADVQLELSPMLIIIFNDRIEKFGPRSLLPNIINVWNSAQVYPL